MLIKWGIVSAGNISGQFVKAVSVLPKYEHEVLAIAARDLERAKVFAANNNIPKAYGDYKSLAEDPEIDVVYIGTLNTQHLEVAKLMLSHKKHVLCEKPLTINEKQTTELLAYAQEQKLFLMEGIWSRCFPAYETLKKIIGAGVIGEVLYVNASFGKPLNNVERLTSKELGGGTILDLGVYLLQFTQFIFGLQLPQQITAAGHLNAQSTDESSSAIITYPGGKTATLSTHARIHLPNEALIIGTKGLIRVPRFWCPTSLITPNETLNMELPKSDVQFKNHYNIGLCYEAEEVRNCIKAGLLESPKMTHAETLQLAQLMDKLRRDVGVVFLQDF